MPEKKRKSDDGDDKRPPGRPRVLPPDLDKRHQFRCSSKDFELWKSHADKIGFPNVSAWLRKVANAALPTDMHKLTRDGDVDHFVLQKALKRQRRVPS